MNSQAFFQGGVTVATDGVQAINKSNILGGTEQGPWKWERAPCEPAGSELSSGVGGKETGFGLPRVLSCVSRGSFIQESYQPRRDIAVPRGNEQLLAARDTSICSLKSGRVELVSPGLNLHVGHSVSG